MYNARDIMHRIASLVVGVWLAASLVASAGPWGDLPDAVARLQENPGDRSAMVVVGQAEASVLREATRGRLAAVPLLMETYASLVVRLDDGEDRLRAIETRTAIALVVWGDDRRESDLGAAAAAWALAARYDAAGAAVDRLRQVLLPPVDPEDGQTWRSPIDDAELVYHPPLQIRVGCSENDVRCRDNEIYFRWVDLPGFWLEATEVTNRRYRHCVEAGGCSPPTKNPGFEDEGQGQHPVVGVRWSQARAYARWAGKRLPSEAEWERAARAKVVRPRFPWGRTRRSNLANVWDATMAGGRGTLPVGTFPVTGWGLFDMPGNVWEWCEDRFQTSYKELPADGSPMRSGFGRVVRGGSWRRDIDLARVSARSWFEEYYSADDVGFRCAMDRSSEISDSRVRTMADRVFAVRVPPGSELVGVELSAEDRRYLKRRTLTWLMLEKRAGEAVLQAESFLHSDPRDPVALEVLEWVESELVEEARAGNVREVKELRSRYLRAVAWSPRFEQRLRTMDERVVEALRECGEAMVRDGNRRQAEACFDTGLEIDPANSGLRRGRETIEPAAGETRIWPEDGKTMVWVPSGAFRFGASSNDRQLSVHELPAGERTVQGFWLDRHEVTNADYRRCVESGACTPPNRTDAYDDPNRGSHPVLWVSWYQAREYAGWAGKRLPSEVEWERAARGGSETRFPWGDKWEEGRANSLDVPGTSRINDTMPVGVYAPNVWGIYDLIGNAAEWVQDVYHSSYGGGPRDGTPWEQETGPSAERRRVIRGGSYFDQASRQRVSRRSARKSTEYHRTLGFRCAAD
jgi:formylglycine-generating enzyme required for sulfatase activity